MGNFSFDKESLRQNFFTTEGRLNRKAFIMRFFGVSISLSVLTSMWNLLPNASGVWTKSFPRSSMMPPM